MKLRVKCLDLDAGGKTIVILNEDDAQELGVYSLDRVVLSLGKKKLTSVINTSEKFVKRGEIVVYSEVKKVLGLRNKFILDVNRREALKSKEFIHDKINGEQLGREELREIVRDVMEKDLNDLELAAFITGLHIHGVTVEEAYHLSTVMAEEGEQLTWKKKYVMDKHSLGGVPGDKTTLLVVPIIAAAGLTIPKTSSRAITSPAGTADRAEVLMPVDLDIREIRKVVNKTNGCVVWGGALNMAPADDLFIKVEYPLGLDPLFMPSIMAKKKAAGSTHLVIDLPTGRGTKVKTFGGAKRLSKKFLKLGHRLGIQTECAVTFGEQPIGYGIGAALEARETLEALSTGQPADLVDKACSLAGILLRMINKGDKNTAYKIIKSGKAEEKFREIIREQGGNEKIQVDDIKLGNKTYELCAQESGMIIWMRNKDIAHIAKLAGAPKEKGVGIKLHHKIGSQVEKGDSLLTIYARRNDRLKEAKNFAEKTQPLGVMGEKRNMLLEVFRDKIENPFFTIER